LHTLVGCEGLHVNHKRVYGVYREAKLQVRRRRRKRITRGERMPLARPSRRTERWSMDFMVDTPKSEWQRANCMRGTHR
jgi:hypothetical protein